MGSWKIIPMVLPRSACSAVQRFGMERRAPLRPPRGRRTPRLSRGEMNSLRGRDTVEESLASTISNWWGRGPALGDVEAIASSPLEHWLSFSEHLQERRYTTSLPLHMQAYCSVSSRPDQLYDPGVLPLASARVRALALFLGEVAILDPLSPLLQRMLQSQSNRETEPPTAGELAKALSQIFDLAPLEQQGAVKFFLRPSIPNSASLHVEAWQTVSRIPDEELDWRWMADPQGLRGDASRTLAAMQVVETVCIARQVSPTGAIHIGTPLERSVIERVVQVSERGSDFRTAVQDFSLLPVPVLIPDSLAIVTARQSDAYVGFRQELDRAIRVVQAIPNSDESWLVTAREVMSDELAAPTAALIREVNGAKFFRSIRRAGRTFGIAGLGGVGGQAMGGSLLAATTSAAITTAGTALADYLINRPSVSGKRAVLETYTMFGPSREHGVRP